MTEQEILASVMETVDEGIICVNRSGVVTHCNRKAKESTGIVLSNPRAHPAGRVEPGDIVLVADNILGDDDGGMMPEDFGCLNLHAPELRPGDAVLVAGVYQDPSVEAICKRSGRQAARRGLELRAVFQGLEITLSIGSYENVLTITVNGEIFPLRYLRSMAHVVLIDGRTGKVKFYQDKGYTIRNEELRELLRGRNFQAKGPNVSEFGVVGRDFFALFRTGELTQRLEETLSGQRGPTVDEELYINQRLMLCSLYPVLEGERVEGVVLKLTDLSEMHKLLEARNDLIKKVEQASLNLDNHTMRVPAAAFRAFAGSSPPIQRVKYLAFKAAQAKCNVILTGESGTGKSQLAREIHNLSRPDGPFIEVNCSSIPRDLFESELFGYVGGAFTGALPGGKLGYFEQANGGTLFLDEIAEMPPDAQVKLLYAIQNRRFYRVGAAKPTDVDVRILAATNRDLLQAVREGNFREDLYYRIHVFSIQLPPLREHISDIYLLSRSLTESICREYGIPAKMLSGSAIEMLLQYDWPGNIRELGNVLERAIAVCENSIIYPEDIDLDLPGMTAQKTTQPMAPGSIGREVGTLREILAATEEQALRQTLQDTRGDKRKAMELLGLRKTTFYEKLRYYHLE